EHIRRVHGTTSNTSSGSYCGPYPAKGPKSPNRVSPKDRRRNRSPHSTRNLGADRQSQNGLRPLFPSSSRTV
ncbi:hypothetical protein M514_28661, partial [Trichuris suis]